MQPLFPDASAPRDAARSGTDAPPTSASVAHSRPETASAADAWWRATWAVPALLLLAAALLYFPRLQVPPRYIYDERVLSALEREVSDESNDV